MARGSPHLQFLRGFTKDELPAIPERCEWCEVRKTDVSVNDRSISIQEPIDRNVSSGNITYTDAMRDIRREVLIPGPETIPQKIRTVLRVTPVSTSTGGGDSGEMSEN